MTKTEYTPVTLHQWILDRLSPKGTEERWLDGQAIAGKQAMFYRDTLHPLIQKESYKWKRGDEGFTELTPMVVGKHHSKSITLPVVRYRTSQQIEVISRCNFYDWKFSISCPEPIRLPEVINGLTSEGYKVRQGEEPEPINPIYCEGFQEHWVFGTYASDPSRFTVEVPGSLYNSEFSNGLAFTFMYLLGEAVGR